FSNPFLGVIAGAVLTAVIQSSSASVGILQALCATGAMTFGSALPIIMGQNIGTCATALISSMGANKNAKRAAMVHLYFNVIGTVIFMALFYILDAIVGFSFVNEAANPAGIAVIHSVFNIFATLILLPFTKLLEKLACMTIRDKQAVTDEQDDFQLLDHRFLSTPAFAIEQCRTVTAKMADISKDAFMSSLSLLNCYSEKTAEYVVSRENIVDTYEDKIGTYLVQLSSKSLSESDSKSISMLLHCIGDFERISDHAVNILEAAQEMNQKELHFSQKAKEELSVYASALMEIVNISFNAFTTENLDYAKAVEPLEEVIDELRSQLKKRHIKRLRKGKCTIELGFILQDIITDFERIADHCSNIAVCLIQLADNSFDTHEYLNELRNTEDREFGEKYRFYRHKYLLP
ncbi:MAG: Na/Pi cotransporter family protein, partial [Ruminiclostridium sp.]